MKHTPQHHRSILKRIRSLRSALLRLAGRMNAGELEDLVDELNDTTEFVGQCHKMLGVVAADKNNAEGEAELLTLSPEKEEAAARADEQPTLYDDNTPDPDFQVKPPTEVERLINDPSGWLTDQQPK